MNELRGRVAVITGAASGFGHAYARLAARHGMRLALADIEGDALDQVVGELAAAGCDVLGEVASCEGMQAFATRVYERHGAAHLLINNAGVATGGLAWESSDADWRWVLGVNLLGVVHGIRHFVPRMLDAERRGEPAHIVNVASVAGMLAPPLLAVYNVSKHAVVALTETLYHDLRLAGSAIGVTLVCPAFVPTGIARSDRNRPRDLANPGPLTESQKSAQAATEKAVVSGRISAAEVAKMTFDAVRAGRYCVFTHPQILPSVDARFAALLAGGPPADPYATRPGVRPAAG
jgi:NAD(P)-dependent dehydrogenase (short-subunit alcohol dehydrogenase family)